MRYLDNFLFSHLNNSFGQLWHTQIQSVLVNKFLMYTITDATKKNNQFVHGMQKCFVFCRSTRSPAVVKSPIYCLQDWIAPYHEQEHPMHLMVIPGKWNILFYFFREYEIKSQQKIETDWKCNTANKSSEQQKII